MNICFLTKELVHGGAQRQLVLLAKALARRGHCVTVVLFYGGGQIGNELRDSGVTIVDLRKGGRWRFLGFLWRLVNCLRRLRPDVLHSYLGVPNILSVGLGFLIRGTHIVWGIRASDTDWEQYGRVAPWLHKTECLFSRYPDLVIVNSHKGFEHALRSGFPRGKMAVVPNGIETDRFKPNRGVGIPIRKEWGIRDGETLVGLVARLDPMKDHATFLRAAAQVERETSGVRFVCVGDGPEPYGRSLRMLAASLGLDRILIWAGARNDMTLVYNAIDIACSSSSFGEGFSNVVGEAMACGVPCVVTDVGDSAQIVGEFGKVVPPGNPQALAGALLATIQELRSQGDRGAQARRDYIVSRFAVSELVDRTEALLEALVSSHR